LRILYEQAILPWLFAAHKVDVIFNPGFTAPMFALCPSVTVFHDLQHRRFPRFFRWWDLPFWRLLLWQSAASSTRLIAVSEATAQDMAGFMPRYSAKTSVVLHGVDMEFFGIGERRRTCMPEPYILAVSTLHPHKNLDRLLDAFSRFAMPGNGCTLIIAGLKGLAAERLEKQVSRLPRGRQAILTGWIPRDQLYRLFERASAFISPGLIEGFGLPVVEALAAGIPTACSNIAVFDPLVGDAAVRFDPESVAGIEKALEQITSDQDFRRRAAIAGPEQVRGFSWTRTAAMTMVELKKAAVSSSPEV
jgi:glycosyltransferase involved in cell wall biosynthesis